MVCLVTDQNSRLNEYENLSGGIQRETYLSTK